MAIAEFKETRVPVIPVLPRDHSVISISSDPIALSPSVELRPTRLSPRQREVLTLFAQGFSGLQVSQMLGIDEETVKNHGKNIKIKLGDADSMDEAIIRGFRVGELDLESLAQELEPERVNLLPPRRKQFLDDIVEDAGSRPYKQIAPFWQTSEQGIKKRASEIFAILGVRNRTHAITLNMVNNAQMELQRQIDSLPLVEYNALHILAENPSIGNANLAQSLHVSISVIEPHMQEAYRRLGFKDKAQAGRLVHGLEERKKREWLASKRAVAIPIYVPSPAPEPALV